MALCVGCKYSSCHQPAGPEKERSLTIFVSESLPTDRRILARLIANKYSLSVTFDVDRIKARRVRLLALRERGGGAWGLPVDRKSPKREERVPDLQASARRE